MSIPDLKDAKDALKEISADKEAKEIARLREKARLDMGSMLADSREQGKAEKSLAILRSLLTAQETKSLTDAKLAMLIGLTVEDVAKVRAELFKAED